MYEAQEFLRFFLNQKAVWPAFTSYLFSQPIKGLDFLY